jgi:signal transduction histidine kinase
MLIERRRGIASVRYSLDSITVTTRTAADPRSRFPHAVARGVAEWAGATNTLRRRTGARAVQLWTSVPVAWRLLAIAAVGALAAVGVGYAVSGNPAATPAHVAVPLRVTIIATLVGTGLYVRTVLQQARMGSLIVAAGLFTSLCLLNGASDRLLFTVGVLCTGAAPALWAYLMLAYPAGHLHSPLEQRFLRLTGGMMTALWALAVLMAHQPPLRTPLIRCAPHCSPHLLSLGSSADSVKAVKWAMVVAWIALSCGTAWLVAARARSASPARRRSLVPVVASAVALALLLVCFFLLEAVGISLSSTVGDVLLATGMAIPLAILVGLTAQHAFMSHALADLIDQLAGAPDGDPEATLAAGLGDPSLRIYYRRPALGTYVDQSGASVRDLNPTDRAVTWIARDRQRVAAVAYDPDLADFERYVRAAGGAALIRLEKAQAEADLKASTADLAASRVRLVEMATAERRRLERDLHDGVQQHLVGLRLKLELAAETIKEDPVAGERAVTWLGRQMDDVLDELRSLARGIYPALLGERGLRDALRAAALTSPISVEVRASGIERYGQELEIAVYFCCLEAIQNVVKHGGRNATATVSLWAAAGRLNFEVRNPGIGFDPDRVQAGSGLVNMRDRVEAVGGTLHITSNRGRGVRVRGSVPVG